MFSKEPKVCQMGVLGLRALTNSVLEQDASPEQIYALVTGMIQEDLLYLLALNLYRLAFESRKDAQVIFSYVLRFRPPTASPKSEPLALSYVINSRPEVLVELCNGYDHKESATAAGTVLREVLKSDAAAAIILYHDPTSEGAAKGLSGIQPEVRQSGQGVFWKFFAWIDQGSFEVGADAFTTFRVSLYNMCVVEDCTYDITGAPYQTQADCGTIPLHEFRPLFR